MKHHFDDNEFVLTLNKILLFIFLSLEFTSSNYIKIVKKNITHHYH
jgi:hypothetical protein